MRTALSALLIVGCTVPIEPKAPDADGGPPELPVGGEREGTGGTPGTACPEGRDPLDCSAEGGCGRDGTDCCSAEGGCGGEGEVDPGGEGEADPGGEGEVAQPPVGEGEGEGCEPGPELCNNLDDDCDGEIDERAGLEASGFVGISCGDDSGACRPGSVERVDGELGCTGMVLPGPEECDGLDNDCDGDVDEGDPGAGVDCGLELGECEFGLTECSDGGIECRGETRPEFERCDGLDNDCDGQVDEDWPDLGDGCQGAGACGRGSMICAAGGEATCCSAVEGCSPDLEPGQEICDGIDNDCNEVIDDAWGIGEACPGQGRCGAGVWECDGPDQRVCSTWEGGSAYGGRPEVCDGVDDDCDAAADEHADGMGAPCDNGLGACVRIGALACVDGVPRCDAVAGDPVAEICNLVDDDCDGTTDEDTAGLACHRGHGACLREGVGECRAGAVVCSVVAGDPAEEICDGVDNDCDAQTDEPGLPGVGEPCTAGVGACERPGALQCAGGDGLRCDAVAGDPGEEVCDGTDGDCNGVIDDIVGGAAQCEKCASRCPVDDLPDGAQLCVAMPGNGASCPNGWPIRVGGLSNGRVTGQVACTPCDCGATVTRRASRGLACGSLFDLERFTCGSQQGGVEDDDGGDCDSGCEGHPLPSHSGHMEIIRWGGGETQDSCELEGGRNLRLCCAEAVAIPDGCAAPVCDSPGNALGYLIRGEAFAVAAACGAAGGRAGTLKGGVEEVGACLNCHCSATLQLRLCDTDSHDSCTAAAHGATCETECLGETRNIGDLHSAVPTVGRYIVTMHQDGVAPELTEGAGCRATGEVHVCDLDAGVIE